MLISSNIVSKYNEYILYMASGKYFKLFLAEWSTFFFCIFLVCIF